jgi:hypothetical protein
LGNTGLKVLIIPDRSRNAEAIRDPLRRRPFVPFRIVLSNGEKYEVVHPEFVVLTKNGIVITYPNSDRITICALLHIANVETEAASHAA